MLILKGTPYIERFNVKAWSLDHTCIHGVNKASGVTVFPHAIAQGASWDLDLVRRVSNATAIEARILSAKEYFASGRRSAGSALSCDGGTRNRPAGSFFFETRGH